MDELAFRSGYGGGDILNCETVYQKSFVRLTFCLVDEIVCRTVDYPVGTGFNDKFPYLVFV